MPASQMMESKNSTFGALAHAPRWQHHWPTSLPPPDGARFDAGIPCCQVSASRLGHFTRSFSSHRGASPICDRCGGCCHRTRACRRIVRALPEGGNKPSCVRSPSTPGRGGVAACKIVQLCTPAARNTASLGTRPSSFGSILCNPPP